MARYKEPPEAPDTIELLTDPSGGSQANVVKMAFGDENETYRVHDYQPLPVRTVGPINAYMQGIVATENPRQLAGVSAQAESVWTGDGDESFFDLPAGYRFLACTVSNQSNSEATVVVHRKIGQLFDDAPSHQITVASSGRASLIFEAHPISYKFSVPGWRPTGGYLTIQLFYWA